jgi:hypothetical protein
MDTLYFEVFLSPFNVRIPNGWSWKSYRNIEIAAIILIWPNIHLLFFDSPIRWFAQPFWEYVSKESSELLREKPKLYRHMMISHFFWWFMVKFQDYIDWQNNVYLRIYSPIYSASNEISSELNLNDSPQVSHSWSSQFINGRCTLKFPISISITNRQLQLSQVSWELADAFCPWIILTDGLIVCVSTVCHAHLIGDRKSVV